MAAQVLTDYGVTQINHNLFMLKIYCRCDTTTNEWVEIGPERRIQGEVVCVDTVPGPEAAPTNSYDLELNNAQGVDVMGGGLADRSNTVAERAWPIATVGQVDYITETPVDGCLAVTLANNNVNGADWTMYIYYRKPVDEGLG